MRRGELSLSGIYRGSVKKLLTFNFFLVESVTNFIVTVGIYFYGYPVVYGVYDDGYNWGTL